MALEMGWFENFSCFEVSSFNIIGCEILQIAGSFEQKSVFFILLWFVHKKMSSKNVILYIHIQLRKGFWTI